MWGAECFFVHERNFGDSHPECDTPKDQEVRIPIGSMVLLYMVTWIPSIYPHPMLAYIPAPWILWDMCWIVILHISQYVQILALNKSWDSTSFERTDPKQWDVKRSEG